MKTKRHRSQSEAPAPSASRVDLAVPPRYYIPIDIISLTISPIWEEQTLSPYFGIFYA